MEETMSQYNKQAARVECKFLFGQAGEFTIEHVKGKTVYNVGFVARSAQTGIPMFNIMGSGNSFNQAFSAARERKREHEASGQYLPE